MKKILDIRGKSTAWTYRHIFKPIAFRLDPEKVHDSVTSLGASLGRLGLTRSLTEALFSYRHTHLEQTIAEMKFTNPVGLAAGFDKNARLINILPAVGFGFAEIGSITARPCAGNPKPRLHRLPDARGLIVNYGLFNDGSQAIAARLAHEAVRYPLGISLAPTNDARTATIDAAIDDYLTSFDRLAPLAGYITLNLSCPNTTHDQPFRDPANLTRLLRAISEHPTKRPIFLKLSPDLSVEELDRLIDCARGYGVTGLIISNLTKDRARPGVNDKLGAKTEYTGGLSGKFTERLANELLKHAYQKTRGSIVLIGCGGIFSAEDAYRKIRLGASLVQLATGMIFMGPQLIGQINQGLVALLRRDHLHSITDAIGLDA